MSQDSTEQDGIVLTYASGDRRGSPQSSMKRDVLSAYLLTGARVITWLLITAVAFQRYPYEYFAALSLIRWTIGLLGYTSVGLGPALVHELAKAQLNSPEQARVTRGSGVVVSFVATALTLALTAVYYKTFPFLHTVPAGVMMQQYAGLILWFGIGDALRVLSEPQGAVLQTTDKIALDNVILVIGEAIWAGLSVLWLPAATKNGATVVPIASSFAVASLFVWLARLACSTNWRNPRPALLVARWKIILGLLGFGSFVLVTQLSEFLYAPTDMVLINNLLTPKEMAAYSPAIQVDAGLLLLMTGLAAVLLPKAALAHAAGDRAAVKMYYIKGTLLGGGLLTVIAFLAWALSASWLRWWLSHPMGLTRAVLPLVLVNTVVGGSSAVGRSILLGMGKVRVFSVAVILAGATNVVCSYVFVKYFHLGLKGIILGTLVAVIARCGIWMPWYVMRTLNRDKHPMDETPMPHTFDVLPIE